MIKKPSELTFEDEKYFIIIAGVPGIGKTTLGLSAPKPLLVDLDKGVSRVEARFRSDTLIAGSYEELMNDLQNEDLSDYESIIIDTGGKLFEMIKPVVIKEDARNGRRDGNLSLQGYGASKKKFNQFVEFVKGLNKHVIMTFHASEVNLDNDVTGLRIRIEGSSKDDVWDSVDIGGFVEIQGKERVISFSNCERFYAKGTHGIHGTYQIPTLNRGVANNFLTQLIEAMHQNSKEDTMQETKYKEVMKYKPLIEKATNGEELTKYYHELKQVEHCLTSKAELEFALKNQVKKLGAEYDKGTDSFITK